MNTIYTVEIDGKKVRQYEELSDAVRAWDELAYREGCHHGGISVISTDSEGVVWRDEWIIHVHSAGNVYLNPNIMEQR